MQPQPYYVLEIHRPGQPPQTLTVTAPRQLLGREGGDIALSDLEASARHAEIEFEHGNVTVRDLGSSNGTWKDGRALPQFALSDGQVFQIGSTTIKLVQTVGAQAPMRAGGTVLGTKAQMLAASGAGSGLAGPGMAPVRPSSGPGLAIALSVVGLAAVGTAGFFGWRMLSADADTEVASADTAEKTEPTEPETNEDAVEDDEQEKQESQEPTTVAEIVEKDLGELYKQVGAATVVIRVPGSVGSGSIVDPRGVILTNNHVIDSGERDGLRIKAQVTLGKFNDESQAYEPDDQYEAWVLKVDPDKDLALIQLEDPPENLPSITLASDKPYPGQKVAAVGHAGAGMLWAIKGGEVSATGSLAGHTDLQIDDAQGYEKDMLSKLKARMEKQGRVIQSTAKILPGDSGGPLVDPKGNIVGVNAFGRIDRATGQWLSFHIHLAEVQEFMKEMPTDPLDFIPDPWGLQSATPELADVDLDGVSETLVAKAMSGPLGSTETGYYFDLDQGSLPEGASTPTWEDLQDEQRRRFDAELAVLYKGGERHFFYDSDDDDEFDTYLLDKGSGHVTEAYRIQGKGKAESDESLIVADGLDAKLLSSAVRDRFQRVGPIVFPGAVSRESGTEVPEPLGEAGKKLQALDVDADGTHEVFSESTTFHHRTLWDLDQNADAESAYVMRSRLMADKAEVEVAAVIQSPNAWIWYDTDDDGALDLMFETTMSSSGVITRAHEVDAKGNPKPGAEVKAWAGQLLVQPSLVPESMRDRLKKVAARETSPLWLARGPGLGRFPSTEVTAHASVTMTDYDGHDNAVARVTEMSHDLVLVDLDRNSGLGKADQLEAAGKVRDGKLDAEFAMLRSRGYRWAFYDTDGKGGFDLVVFGEGGTPSHAYTIAGDQIEAVDAGTHMAQWGRFESKKLRASFETLAPKLFPGYASE